MKGNRNNKILVDIALVFFYSLSSCIPPIDSKCVVCFRNCTTDTLYIVASRKKNIDSIDNQLTPDYDIYDNIRLDTTNISLWKEKIIKNSYIMARKDCFVYPDSGCVIDYNYLNDKDTSDTCYFFLIKWSDAKRYSWDEIRANKLYRKWIVTKDEDGNYDTNIRYSDSDEQE